jgi:hypothetical protein
MVDGLNLWIPSIPSPQKRKTMCNKKETAHSRRIPSGYLT